MTHDGEIDAELEEVRGFVDKIIPKAIKDAGGILNDQVRFWRWKNQVKIFKKASDLLGQDAPLHKVGLKVLVPLIENGSLEDSDTLQNKWASMLANATSQAQRVLPLFPALLKELSDTEVAILDVLYGEYRRSSQSPTQFSKEKVRVNFNLSKVEVDVMIENLFRLNICSSPGSVGALIGDYPFSVHTNEIFELTALGVAFIESCKYQNPER